MKKPIALLLVLLSLSQPGQAEPVDYVREVRPILQKHCVSCHGENRQRSGLRLDVKSEAFKGGDAHGPSILPRKAAESPLIRLVTTKEAESRMPPRGDGLSATEIATLTRWINEGATWPDGVDLATVADRRDHWSFKPLRNPVPPEVRDPSWARNPIDRFILARLEKEGLSPAPPAAPVAWLRRVTLDLTGLPPTPQEVTAFLQDLEGGKEAPAREAVVDRLLASPRYGERWGQHWLDVVRYADTHGFEVNTERPNAWPYRDYIIEAFNRDTPYDRFIREQLVGDALGQQAATGFLVTASVLLPGQIGADDASKRLARQDSLDEIVVNIGQTFLGLSIGCARCHDHKFDPISQREYYSMQAFVAGVEYADRELDTPELEANRIQARKVREELAQIDNQLARLVPLAGSGVKRSSVNARQNVDRFAPVQTQRVRFTINTTNNLEPCIDELEVFTAQDVNIGSASRGTKVTSSGDRVAENRHELRFINDGEYGNSRSWMSSTVGKGWVVLEFPEPQVIDRVVWGRDRQGKFTDRLSLEYRIEVELAGGKWQTVADSSDRAKFTPDRKPNPVSTEGLAPADARTAATLLNRQKDLQSRLAEITTPRLAFAGSFRKPDAIHLLHRGDPEQPRDRVAPAAPKVLGLLSLEKDAPEQQRRAALADWIASPGNPLTARVMVNRIWQGHLGTGLVDTPSDFGRNGTRPTHPELLDWLAQEFIRSSWSIKHLHRSIVLSATYGQAIRQNATAAAKDADVRLLWRFPSRRLEAETIRDSMLAVSGQLNLKMGGRGFDLFDRRGGLTGFKPVESFPPEGLRRMVYAHKVRRERDSVFGAFDCPDAGQSTARRSESTTPIQALNLFNSRFTLDQSTAFASRVQTDVGSDPVLQIRRAYQLALNRDPDPSELSEAEPIVRAHGLATLGRVLFNTNEFLFLP